MGESSGRRLAGAVWLVGAGAIAKLLFLVATMLLYKGLALHDSGAFGLAYAFATTFVIVAELGLRGYTIRELAKVREDRQGAQGLFGDVIALRVGLSGISILLATVFVWAARYDQATIQLTAWLLAFAILDSLATLLKSIYRVYDRMDLDALTSIGGRAAIVVALSLLYTTKRMTLTSASAVYLAGAFLECAVLGMRLRRVTGLTLLSPPSLRRMRGILVRSMPFAVLAAIGILYLRTGTFTLSKLDDLREMFRGWEGISGGRSLEPSLVAVAWFYAASRLPDALTFFPLAVVNAYIPFLSRNAENHDLVQSTFASLLRYVGLAGLICAGPLAAEPELVLRILAKSEFLPAAPALRMLALSIPLTFVLYVMANLLLCLGEEKLVMRRYVTALGANVLFNLLLVPVWGTLGAALALLLSEATAMLLDLLVLRRRRVSISAAIVAQFCAVGAAMMVTAFLVRPLPAPVRLALIATSGAGAALAILWREDRDVVQKVLGKFRLRSQN